MTSHERLFSRFPYRNSFLPQSCDSMPSGGKLIPSRSYALSPLSLASPWGLFGREATTSTIAREKKKNLQQTTGERKQPHGNLDDQMSGRQRLLEKSITIKTERFLKKKNPPITREETEMCFRFMLTHVTSSHGLHPIYQSEESINNLHSGCLNLA